MILGADAIEAAIVDGLIYHSEAPDPKEERKEFRKWCRQFIQPASLDVALGANFAYMPVEISPAQQINYASQTRYISTEEDSKLLYKFRSFSDFRNGEAPLGPGHRVLAHTSAFIGLAPNICAQVATRSTAARWGLDVCGSAGWVDPGYHSRITLEISNFGSNPILLREGVCYAQLVFMEVSQGKEPKAYTGHYNCHEEEWTPSMMLPKGL